MSTMSDLHLTLDDAAQFFYDHVGYSYPTDAEIKSVRWARAYELAAAEVEFFERGWKFSIEADLDPMWDDDVEREHTDYDQWIVTLFDAKSYDFASLGSIDLGPDANPWQSDYVRVVIAELALEGLS